MKMKITCISAANIERASQNSASVRACQLVESIIVDELHQPAEVNILPLLHYEMKPCRMCGECFDTLRCQRDPAFNAVIEQMISADVLFFVVPHYAPLPSKLMMVLEKMEEMAFLRTCADEHFRSPFHGKRAGVIGHGGQGREAIPYYQKALVEPVAAALAAVQLRVVGAGEESPHGAAFGITALNKLDDSIFVKIEHDWEEVRARLRPLVRNVIQAAA